MTTPSSLIKRAPAIVSLLALASLANYAFTGNTWWAPIGAEEVGRQLLVIFFHLYGLVAWPITKLGE